MHKYFKNFIQIGIAIILSLVIIILTAESIPIITGFFSLSFHSSRLLLPVRHRISFGWTCRSSRQTITF